MPSAVRQLGARSLMTALETGLRKGPFVKTLAYSSRQNAISSKLNAPYCTASVA